MMVTLIFVLQVCYSRPYQPGSAIPSGAPDFWAEKFGLRHGNTALAGDDLSTRAMFIICKPEENL